MAEKKNKIDVEETTVEDVQEIVQETAPKAVPEAVDPNEFLKERIPYQAFKDDNRYKDDIVVIVNGENFIIKRGVIVQIPRYVIAVLESKDRELRTANLYKEAAMLNAGF